MQPSDDAAVAPTASGKHSSFSFVDRTPVLAALGGPGQVLDLGCGVGNWSLALASGGTPVLAIDRWRAGLGWLGQHGQGLPLLALEADLGAPLPVADGAVGGVLLSLVLHHLRASGVAARLVIEVARVLRPGGLMAVVEFLPVPPPPGPPLAARLSTQQVLALSANAGLIESATQPIADHVALYVSRKPS
ncbi:class I SAM-dependent methyltransferase [Immundisolibacter sp.]|uniref:class I SAM-dependent methyltransferase n=1 Tax=Immundisolibacter sp. TaxID=1934948 RepID=UPI0035688EC6